MREARRVLMVFPGLDTSITQTIDGIADVAERIGTWQVAYHSAPQFDAAWFRAWQPAGILVVGDFRARTLAGLNCPVVSLRSTTARYRVAIDDVAVGEEAARHVMALGYRSFAYWGGTDAEIGWRPSRQRGFVAAIRRAGIRNELCTLPWDPEVPSPKHLRHWFAQHPQPLAVFAGNDHFALRLLAAAQDAGIPVPGQLAVVGADDYRAICVLAPVALSSVRVPHRQVGRLAAEMLQELMEGRQPKAQRIVAPDGTTTRASTELQALADAKVGRALAMIDQECAGDLCVDDVVATSDIGRRALEKRFQAALGYGILQAINQARVRRVLEGLGDRAKSLTALAMAHGFTDSSHLSRVFRRLIGMSPTDYRDRLPLD